MLKATDGLGLTAAPQHYLDQTTGEGGGSEPVLAFSSRHKKARVPAHHKWTSIEVQGSDVTAGGTRACSNMAFYLRKEQYCGAMLIAQQ